MYKKNSNNKVAPIFRKAILKIHGASVSICPKKKGGNLIMKKKLLSALLSVAMVASLLVGCGAKTEAPAATEEAVVEEAATEEAAPAEDVTISVAAIETAYGSDIWVQVAEAFTAETGIKVDLTTDKNLEDVI